MTKQPAKKELRLKIVLESPSPRHCDEFLAAVSRSPKLHRHWVTPPRTAQAFRKYVKRFQVPSQVAYLVRTGAGEIAGVIHIMEIVRKIFRSGYLGYYAFEPHDGQGYMTEGLRAVISRAFGRMRLHRLEANIQPGNEPSRRLVQRLGFRCEGFSPRYLKIAGKWRDHERWALTAEEWTAKLKSGR